jgi:hypothetical protein
MYKFYENYTQIIFLHGKYENKNCIKIRHDGYISSKCLDTDMVYSKHASCVLNSISTLFLLSLGGGVLVSESMTRCFCTDMVY